MEGVDEAMSMKLKITNRKVRDGYPTIFVAGYCAWQNIISACKWECVGYASGTLGWNYDVFEILPWMCLVTGYRGFPKATCETDWKTMDAFDREAGELRRDCWSKDYEEKRQKFTDKVVAYLRKLVDEKETKCRKTA